MKTSFGSGTVLFIFFGVLSFVVIGVPSILIAGENSEIVSLFVGQIAIFLIPALLYAYYAYHDFWNDLGLKKAGKISDHSSFILLYLLTIPLVGFLVDISEILPFPEPWVEASKRMEAMLNEIVFGLLSDGTFANLMFTLLVIAVLPAICEEIFFRGVVLTNIAKRTGNIHLAVWLSAIFFSAIHFEILGFLPRILLGAVLGYSFILTKSLWIPIIIHFLNNGVLVFLYFSYQKNWIGFNPSEITTPVPIWLVAVCVVAGFVLLRYLLRKGDASIAPTEINH
ncbi:MAG: CPBP family intramembrane metalloprotease [Bacteroidales bacterium]|nr:CPBP family intramembrane metalloprotease [Bacteroidales bacterium]